MPASAAPMVVAITRCRRTGMPIDLAASGGISKSTQVQPPASSFKSIVQNKPGGNSEKEQRGDSQRRMHGGISEAPTQIQNWQLPHHSWQLRHHGSGKLLPEEKRQSATEDDHRDSGRNVVDAGQFR